MSSTKTRTGAALAYIACVVAANWATAHYGLVPVGWGQMVTAGTFAAGLSFVARDALQDAAGRRWVLAAIVAGAALSALLSPIQLAVASGATFLVSESTDMAVYTPLRRRGHRLAGWLTSNIVGSLIDTALFLWLAGFPLAGFPGQAAVKITVGVVTPLLVAGLIGARRAVLRDSVNRAGA
jgi:uncharacterized PurR-regulated membrane protein YhhQ (DUF165 family)